MSVENLAAVNAAFQEMQDNVPEARPYNNQESGDAMREYIASQWPDDRAAENSQVWEIAFRALLKEGRLTAIPNYQSPLSDADRKMLAEMSGAEVGRLYRSSAEFRVKWDAYAAEDKPWAKMTAEDYRRMPAAECARLLLNPLFRARVDQLISEGKI